MKEIKYTKCPRCYKELSSVRNTVWEYHPISGRYSRSGVHMLCERCELKGPAYLCSVSNIKNKNKALDMFIEEYKDREFSSEERLEVLFQKIESLEDRLNDATINF